MKTQKILIGTLVAGVSMFLLGWLIYGIMLHGFMEANCNNSSMRPMEQMIWWAMIAANLVGGLLLAIILDWSGSITMMSGAKVGAIVGFLMALTYDLSMYATTTMFNGLKMVAVDSLCSSLMLALTGMITAMVMGKIGQPKA